MASWADKVDDGQGGSADAVAEALVREYLARRPQLADAFAAYERCAPRTPASLTNKALLRKALGVERHVARLKKQGQEVGSTLEALASYQLGKVGAVAGPGPAAAEGKDLSNKGKAAPAGDVKALEKRVASTSLDDDDNALLSALETGAAPPRPAGRAAAPPRTRSAPQEELVMEDFDEDFDLGPPAAAPPPRTGGVVARGGGAALQPEDARKMRTLLFGRSGLPPPSWKQGFFFTDAPGLAFGVVQPQGGPCGVVASVQAHVLLALEPWARPVGRLSPSEQRAALVAGLAAPLWRAGGGRGAALVRSGERSTSGLSVEDLCRTATVERVPSRATLEAAIEAALPQYSEEDGHGLLLFLLSLVATRGVDTISRDMDDAATGLMGAHGYCNMDLINLILTGRACSNVFDGEKDLGGMRLGGVDGRAELGLLTLFEWYRDHEVGSYLKRPQQPVWVVCSESHFSCLFATDRSAERDATSFDLMYFDGLARQEEPIRLSVGRDPDGGHTGKYGENRPLGELVPPLEFIIETRWPGSSVDWNGAEPIL